MIPKLIMQTWKTHNIPSDWKTSPESLKKYMPNWKYVLLSDQDNEDFVQKHFKSLLPWFKNLTYPIQRADVVRYMWLYVHGGLYIDLDIEVLVSLEELFDRDMDLWLLKAPKNLAGHYTNFLMASTPNNKFWLKVIEECTKPLEPWVILPHLIISQETGLAALTRAVDKWEKPFGLLPHNALVPCDYCNVMSCEKPFSYTKFLKGRSWNGYDTMCFNFLICKNPSLFS
jgi:mannosyltransferase OCH1-like enzyme